MSIILNNAFYSRNYRPFCRKSSAFWGLPPQEQEDLAVPLRTRHAALRLRRDGETDRSRELLHCVDRLSAHPLVAHDAALAHPASTRLELRLHQGDHPGIRGKKKAKDRKDLPQRNEGYIHRGQRDRFGEKARGGAPEIDSLEGHDARIAPQGGVKEAPPDVRGVNPFRAAPQEAVGEPAG